MTVATAALPYSWNTKSATLPWTPISSLALLEMPYSRKSLRSRDEIGIRTSSPYSVTRGEQACDSALHLIVSQLESNRNLVGVMP